MKKHVLIHLFINFTVFKSEILWLFFAEFCTCRNLVIQSFVCSNILPFGIYCILRTGKRYIHNAIKVLLQSVLLIYLCSTLSLSSQLSNLCIIHPFVYNNVYNDIQIYTGVSLKTTGL
jgi:hypothetical protein